MEIHRRLLAEAKDVKGKLILVICLGLLGGILGIFQAFGLSQVINQVFLQHSSLQSVAGTILALVVIVTLRATALYGGETSAPAAARRILGELRLKLFFHIYKLGPAYLHNPSADGGTRTGELVNLATEGIDALEAYYSQYLPQIALAILVPVTILVFVFQADILSGLILLATAPLIPVFMVLIGGAANSLTRKQWLGLSRMSGYFLDVIQGLTTLKSFGQSKAQVGIIEKVSDQYRCATMGVLKVTFLSALALELVATLSTAVVAVEIGIRLLYGKMLFEQAFFVLLLAPEFYLPLRSLGSRFHASMAGIETGKRLYEVLDTPVPGGDQEETQSDQDATPSNIAPSIGIKDLTFSYPGNVQTLDCVSFQIPAGKMTAISGESGAGKTTLTWLLLRFLEPQAGEISINQQSIREIPCTDWMAKIAWVPQNPHLFDDTVAANIMLSKPGADMAAVKQAAQLANADDFISKLAQGYQTRLGEGGARLSAGQAQRIALARAFLKDAPFIILDEATAHLDPLTDAQLRISMRQLFQDRTALVIAHRKTTLAEADQVIKLVHGHANLEGLLPFTEMQTIPAEEQVTPADGKYLEDIIDLPNNLTSHDDHNGEVKASPLRRLLATLTPFWTRILLSVGLGFATVASGVGLMATSAYIISAAALHPSIAELQVAIVGVRFFGLSRGVFRYLERLVSHDVTFRLLANWRVKFYQALEPLAPAWLQRYHSGDLLARIIRDIGTLENFYVRAINPPLVALMISNAVIIFLGGFAAPLAWGLLAFLVFAGIFLPLMVFFLSKKIGPLLVSTRSALNTLLVDSLQGIPDLLTNGRMDDQLRRIKNSGQALSEAQGRMARISSIHVATGSLLANLAMLTVLTIGIELVSAGKMDGVLLGVVTLTALTCFEAMQPLPQVVQHLETNQSAAGRLYELVDAPNPVKEPTSPIRLDGKFDLEVHHLSFTYPAWEYKDTREDRQAFTLKGISFTLPQGKHVAILGPSGSGKTTLVNLLQRFWDYQQGSILLNKHEINQFCQEDVRARIAYVSQNTYLFCATIRDNLRLARPSATLDELRQAAKHAQLDDFIQALPAGYDTWIGEHGLRLSAGERQRLAIARAFLKDASLLIMDEPAANLDPANEGALLDAVQTLSQGRSMIYITQNMSGLEMMDEIIVLNAGQVVERGKHAKLYDAGGLYRQMWNLYHQII
jgi:ATP-binding cassette subfamily C protein CydCD